MSFTDLGRSVVKIGRLPLGKYLFSKKVKIDFSILGQFCVTTQLSFL